MTTVKWLVFIVWHLLIYQKDIYIVHYSRTVPVQRFSERNSDVDVKVTPLFLGRSHHYKHSVVVITNWLTVTRYPFLKLRWIYISLLTSIIFSFLHHMQDFYRTWLWVKRWVSYDQKGTEKHSQRFGCTPVFAIFLLFCIYFFCLRSVSCARFPGLSIRFVSWPE